MTQQVVNIPVALFESIRGRYFVGQSGLLSFGHGKNAWCGLFNCCNSHVELFVNVFTITNISEADFIAQFWFNPNLLRDGNISDMVTPSNRAICPSPRPKAQLKFAENVIDVPTKGINAFDRLVPAKTTVAQDEDGKYIIPPWGSFVIFLDGQKDVSIQARVALGWWEKDC